MSAARRPHRIVLLVCAAYLLYTLLTQGSDTRVFVTLGPCFAACSGAAECSIGPENGYDGQFAYYIARDPQNAAPCIDAPAYRYQRILLPIVGRILTLGFAPLIPLVFVALNLLALVGSTALLERLLVAQKASPYYALAYGLFGGLVIAVRLSTPEPLAYGLVLLALWWGQKSWAAPDEQRDDWRGRWGMPAALALAALAKETTLIFAAAFALYYAAGRHWGAALRVLLITGLPFALWQLYLYSWLGTFGVGSGGAGGTPFEIIPFNGLWRIWTEGSFGAFVLLGGVALLVAALPALWGLVASAREIVGARLHTHVYAYLLFANAAVMLFVPFSTYREPLGILRFIPGLVIAHVLYAALRFRGRRPLRYSLLWAITLLLPLALR
ncbi:MAG: hypothetical protein HXY40_13415 [Chloroflexi bacterium]|nr:hypothetical protein [Chloroflexota bacterium]